MCHMWHDGSATRPINRHFVPLLLLVQYHPSSTVHTSVIPVFKAFTLNRLNIKRDLWQHISPLDVITGVNFAPSAWCDWFSLLWKVEETKHIYTLWKRLSAGPALNTHDAFWDIDGAPSKKSGQLFATVSRNDSTAPNVTFDAIQMSTSNSRCRRAMPQNYGKLGRGKGERIPGNVKLLPSPPHGSQNETISEYSGLNRGSLWSCATAIITRLAGFASISHRLLAA